ncbi:hypothetical protein ACFVSW_26345 [Neobacillus sp. NPDC058068]|uniref:hypothetical protein n=1 Tax=Neobacillus sp. NPDC058068 TaxID=3346325 RepID=UPI0036DC6896
MKKFLQSFIITVVFGFIGKMLVGNWGFFVAVGINLLCLIYQELSIISSLLKERSSTKKVA